ncbi:hypothetical protein POPTR_001G008600v4 [Populus trichocarpa]|uniref:Uncharacterized protein n=1 Tax=Populus trichocarpa TaxID=3694 RepID=A0ACC0TGP0_POPTR|nr:hypothetical protein POPTR_001G008600v4 [Populus trichocarpa]
MGPKADVGDPFPLDEAWGMQPCELEISRKYGSPFSMQPHINFIIEDLMASSAQCTAIKTQQRSQEFPKDDDATCLHFAILQSSSLLVCITFNDISWYE